jgi:hypothetical protein
VFKLHNFIATCALLLAAASGYYYGSQTYHTKPIQLPIKKTTLHDQFRTLLSEHAYWTRNYLVAAAGELNDISPAAERLFASAKEIGYAFIPYYGKEAGKKMAELMREESLLIMEVIATEKALHRDKLSSVYQGWEEQLQKIADFLSSENSFLKKDRLNSLLHAHKLLTTQEVTARIHKAWKQDIAACQKIFDQTVTIADYISDGITQQFPQKL